MAREPLSRGDLLLLGALLAVAGIADSAYLTYEKYAAAASQACDLNPFFNCTVVQTSPYSSVLGIPTAVLVLGGFVILTALFVLAFRGVERIGPWSVDFWLLLFATLGALIGLGLSLIEVFVIHAICLFCAAGFGLDLGILALAAVLRRRTVRDG